MSKRGLEGGDWDIHEEPFKKGLEGLVKEAKDAHKYYYGMQEGGPVYGYQNGGLAGYKNDEGCVGGVCAVPSAELGEGYRTMPWQGGNLNIDIMSRMEGESGAEYLAEDKAGDYLMMQESDIPADSLSAWFGSQGGYQQGGEVRDKPSGNWGGEQGDYMRALEAQRSITELDRTEEEAEETLRLKRLNQEIKGYEKDRGMKPFDSYSGQEIQKHMHDIMPYLRSFGRLETPAQEKDAFVYRRLGLDKRKPPFQLQGLQGLALLQGLRGEQQ